MGTTLHAHRKALIAPLALVTLMIAAVAPSAQAAGLKVSAISAGLGFTCARSSDGAAWCWGTTPSVSSAMARPPDGFIRSG